MSKISPPRIARWLINVFTRNENIQSMLYNLEEEYDFHHKKHGKKLADSWFWFQTIRSIPRLFIYLLSGGLTMFKHYFIISLRNIKKHKTYSVINLFGLALGMACCILILSYVTTELSYDKFHENSNRIYRLCSDLEMGDNKLNIPKTSYRLMNALKSTYPEIENAAMFSPVGRKAIEYKNKSFYENKIYYATNSVFEVFNFPVTAGDFESPLQTAGSAVITQEIATKYFGKQEPVGKLIKIGDEGEFRITAVMKNVPENSHIRFNILCSFETLYQSNKSSMENWMHLNHRGYLLLHETTDHTQLRTKFSDFIETNLGGLLNRYGASFTTYLQPLTDIHLKSHLEQEISANGDIKYIYIFSGIAFFILIIACINYMNLATARSVKKAKEVGVRKVLGANKSGLMKQFFIESLVYSIISLLLAIMIVSATIPMFSTLFGIQLTLQHIPFDWIIPSLMVVVILVGLISGSYPALYLSAFSPVKTLKSNTIQTRGSVKFRSALVVFQFGISIILIIATTITVKQLDYMRNTNLGFNEEQVLVLPLRDSRVKNSLITLKQELTQHSGIKGAGVSSHVPSQTTFKNPFFPEGFADDNPQWMGQWNIDHDYIATMGIELAAGRNFAKEFTSDTDLAILINETAAEQFGWSEPLGKTIRILEDAEKQQYLTLYVVGVVKDFHFTSLHQKIEPIIITNTTLLGYGALSLRLNHVNLLETIDFIRNKVETIAPDLPFDYFFLDESFDSQYRNEEQLSSIFSSFTVLAILIACLGLIGLASFTAENKTKEIGIRKVMGANISQIIFTLTKEFIKWILIANIIAWPLAYYLMSKWLEDFAYRIDISMLTFLLSGAIAFIIAIITVSYQSIKAACANPIKSIQYE